jgi:hypothetical protein
MRLETLGERIARVETLEAKSRVGRADRIAAMPAMHTPQRWWPASCPERSEVCGCSSVGAKDPEMG